MRMVDSLSDQQLDRLTRMVAIAVVLVALGLAGFYIRERYFLSNVSIIAREEERLTEMVIKDPENVQSRIGIANTFMAKGMYDDAIVQYNEALKMEPDHQGAMMGLAMGYVAKGQDDKAKGYLESLVALTQSDAYQNASNALLSRLEYQLGRIYLNEGRTDDAIEALKTAFGNNQGDADVLYLLGNAFLKKESLVDAETAYQGAVKLVPDFAEVYQSLVALYEKKGEKTNADWARGMVSLSTRDYDGAIRSLNSLVAANPGFAPAYFGLGRAYEAKREVDKAYLNYKKAAELDPEGQKLAGQSADKLEIVVH